MLAVLHGKLSMQFLGVALDIRIIKSILYR